MVQTNQPSSGSAGEASTPSTVVEDMPPARMVHHYDAEKDTASTRVTLDYPGGLVVTTTVEVRLRHPNGYSLTVTKPQEDVPAGPPPPPLPTYHIPVPTLFFRPDNEASIKRYYVVYTGKEVGIFTGEFDAVVGPLVRGIPHNRVEGFSTWDDALYQYTRAYQELRPGCAISVVGSPRPVQMDANYQWGTGQMLGAVDITGLDLDPTLVSNVV
ncbi:hypothetical protein V5O48_003945 [Marasmius crinis-equi]|uniref:Uncharacterized protein n=1 Tax=Marasmius crinis-equi TaxID=585013 RepID=A0ABR3FRN4_9AGAR